MTAKRCIGLMATMMVLATTAAQAQTVIGPTLRLSDAAGDPWPERLTPGASWDAPALAPSDDDRRYGVRWQDPENRWGISAAVNFVDTARLNAADFQTGDLFETEAAVVRKVGVFRIGAVGYSARGVGDSTGRSPKLGPMRWQGTAAGPVVGYDTRLAGKPTTLSLRWYREIGAPGENGDTVSAAFALKF